MVQGWYQGGLSVFDFTDSARPVEIAYFDRGPIDPKNVVIGGYWSTYWFNGHIYGSEMARGLDIFRLLPSEHLSQNEIDAAMQWRPAEFNAQMQPRATWPATTQLARAYVDQLTRSRALTADRVKAITATLARADGIRSSSDRNAGTVAAELDGLAAQVEGDARTATGRDAVRLKALAETLKGRAARLK
jgi:hypothetical protein